MERSTHMSSFANLRETMERCSDIVSDAYSKPIDELFIYNGQLPFGHRSTDRRQRYWVTEHAGDVFVALPGTTHPLDWSSNLRVQYKPVDGTDVQNDQLENVPCAHAGFFYRAETVPTVNLLQIAADKGCRLVFTGHSLGGAVANLCTLAALTAQKRVLEAVADPAAACAGAGTHNKGSGRKCKASLITQPAAATEVCGNCSPCSGISEAVLTPEAALVEVLCVSFASPLFANAALVKHIEDSGWEENFVNVVVPEDYCLKLFNNVLTSANPAARAISRCSSRGSLSGCNSPLPDFEGRLDDPLNNEMREAFEQLDEPISDISATAEAAEQLQEPAVLDAGSEICSSNTSCGSPHTTSVADSGSSNTQRFSYSGNHQQRPLSALAGKNGRSSRSKRQLQISFAQPMQQALAISSDVTSAAVPDAVTPVPEGLSSVRIVHSSRLANEQDVMPSSPSSASLFSEDSSISNSSTRSWTLLAYLPGMLTRSISGRSLSSWGSGRSSSSSGRDSETGTVAEAADSVFASWGMRHAKSSADLVNGLSSNGCNGEDGSSCSEGSLCDDLAAAAAFFTGAGMEQQHSQLQGDMRRSSSSASLTIHNQQHHTLPGQAVMNQSKVTDSLSLVSKLLPSARSLAYASRAVAIAATAVADKAMSVPLNVLERGLVKALKPPMYQPVGQQWILSATGLVPQVQPCHSMYPRYVHDVFWHKELTLVAFREHSIAFYKQRLMKQASRR